MITTVWIAIAGAGVIAYQATKLPPNNVWVAASAVKCREAMGLQIHANALHFRPTARSTPGKERQAQPQQGRDRSNAAIRKAGMKPSIVVYFNGTFVNIENGAHARLSEMLKFYRAHFDDVTLYSYANHGSFPWTDQAIEKFKLGFPHVKLCLDQYTAPLRWFTRLKNFMLLVFPQHASAILALRLPGASPTYSLIRKQLPDAVWIINYSFGITELNGLPNTKNIIIETHDLNFILASKATKVPVNSWRILMKLRNEITYLNNAAALIAISSQERATYGLFAQDVKRFFIPVYLRTTHAEIYTEDNEFKCDLLFVAADGIFNVEGFNGFIQSNTSWLSNYKINLAGTICRNKQILLLSNMYTNICLLGYVDDISSTYKTAKAVISPVEGTGLKMKVIEALLHGKPVFGSDHSRDGLPGEYENCVFPIGRDKIESVLTNSEIRRKAETAAFRYVRLLDRFSEINPLLDYLNSFPQF